MLSEQIIINGLLTSYTSAGVSGVAPPVVFLHGWASSKEVWTGAMQSLPALGVASYALDLPGFGKTETPPEVWSVSDYANFVAEFLQKLKIPPAVIVGHSFGGRIGLVLAATHPQFLAKLILVDSAGVYTSAGFKKMLALASKLIKPFFRLRWTQPLRKKIYRAFGAVDYLATPELNKTFVKVIGEDLTKYLDKITQPMLLIWGKNDFVTPMSYAEYFLKHLPRARLEILDHAGHYSFLDQPADFERRLKDFINE